MIKYFRKGGSRLEYISRRGIYSGDGADGTQIVWFGFTAHSRCIADDYRRIRIVFNCVQNIDKEAEAILSEARKKALANENRIIAEAKEEAARIIERAETEAELEKKKAADDVKREMIVIASMIAGKVVNSSIDATVRDSLIDETLK